MSSSLLPAGDFCGLRCSRVISTPGQPAATRPNFGHNLCSNRLLQKPKWPTAGSPIDRAEILRCAESELPSGLDLGALASFYTTVVGGLAIQARDGASRKALKFAVRCAMATWDAL